MKTAIKLPPALLLFPLLLLSALVSTQVSAHERESCRVCGMYIDQYQKSAAELVLKDGTMEHTCGVACMLREIEDAGGISAFRSVKVHDWVSGKLVDAETATYVIGSKVIPDMIPNYIAFAKREEAEAFMAKEGGEIMDFNLAYHDISEVGTTTPFRIRSAVTPGKGNFSAGIVYGYSQKDQVKNGDSAMEPTDFINANKAQPKAPNESQMQQQAITLNYSPTDNLALFMNLPWFEKRQSTFERTPPAGGPVGESIADENGLGDIALEGRYNFWRSTRWDKFGSVLLGTSLPTGEFNGTRDPLVNPLAKTNLVTESPGLQLGKGTATFTGGLLYSQRWKDFWMHTSALYTVNPENDKGYAYGDVATAGLALHYTPNYNLMLGVEIDASYTEKNEDQGFKIGNSGGTVTNLAVVSDWRFINAFGGNFKLRSSVGLPIYEDLNARDVKNALGLPYTQVQLGNGFFANVSVVWTFRSAPSY